MIILVFIEWIFARSNIIMAMDNLLTSNFSSRVIWEQFYNLYISLYGVLDKCNILFSFDPITF